MKDHQRTKDSITGLRLDLMTAKILLWIASRRDCELTPEAHLYFFDRYQRLAEYHRRRGHDGRARRLQARADEHFQLGGGDGPPYAAAMGMPRPRRWHVIDASVDISSKGRTTRHRKGRIRMQASADSDDALFLDALQGLHKGDFSRLEPLFDEQASQPAGRARIVGWHETGRFRDDGKALAEALTCACFLGRTGVATHFLTHGIEPSGGAGTGLNAFHWAVNRGQLEVVRLLLRWQAPLETRSMYGGNVLDTAVWSAINEPRPHHMAIIEELLKAGARLEEEEWPTGHEEIDRLLRTGRE